MIDGLTREFIYLWYYFEIQLQQILKFWILGILIGSAISVFGKEKLRQIFLSLQERHLGVWGIIPASLLGIASPLCMYGTIPIAASFSKNGMKDDWLAAFMMSSILLNPQLLIYSAALGTKAMMIRFISSFLCGILAGLLIHIFYMKKGFFTFQSFEERSSRDVHPNVFIRYVKNVGRNIKATGVWFLLGMLLTALYQRYIPAQWVASLFGSNEGFGILAATALGVPLYACGGGTIPLLFEWLHSGMSMGSASAFMITGPATKFTNLGALKIVLGTKRFFIYFFYIMVFAFICGTVIHMFFK